MTADRLPRAAIQVSRPAQVVRQAGRARRHRPRRRRGHRVRAARPERRRQDHDVHILSTLIAADAGEVAVGGFDLAA